MGNISSATSEHLSQKVRNKKVITTLCGLLAAFPKSKEYSSGKFGRSIRLLMRVL